LGIKLVLENALLLYKSDNIQIVFPVAVNYTFPGHVGMISAFAYGICTPKLGAILGKDFFITKLGEDLGIRI
jgi:hypothetical protein